MNEPVVVLITREIKVWLQDAPLHLDDHST
jgi:hypothetical protein